jgi:peptidoglycan hydrolase CwlO-like protein
MNEYLPSLLALVGVVITVIFNYRASKIKTGLDGRSVETNAEIAFRDDLLQSIKDNEAKVDKLEEKQEAMQTTISKLREENAEVRSENIKLRGENDRLKKRVEEIEDEFRKIEKRVYYRPDKS